MMAMSKVGKGGAEDFNFLPTLKRKVPKSALFGR